LLKDSTFADFVIKCGKKEYKVHRFILSCHSKYFKTCFEGKFKVRRGVEDPCALIPTVVSSHGYRRVRATLSRSKETMPRPST